MKDWIWMGHAGHLCVSNSYRFHLNTYVGGYIVSTVGEYYPYAQLQEMQTLGSEEDSFYETMVFEARRDKSITCCPYTQSGENIDCVRYATAEKAHKGHLRLCRKWCRK